MTTSFDLAFLIMLISPHPSIGSEQKTIIHVPLHQPSCLGTQKLLDDLAGQITERYVIFNFVDYDLDL
jgi:hypothetical protein